MANETSKGSGKAVRIVLVLLAIIVAIPVVIALLGWILAALMP